VMKISALSVARPKPSSNYSTTMSVFLGAAPLAVYLQGSMEGKATGPCFCVYVRPGVRPSEGNVVAQWVSSTGLQMISSCKWTCDLMVGLVLFCRKCS
jgi:hypothetical protein